MGVVTGGGGGGAAFNGGTITQPLVIDLSAAAGSTVPLTVKASYNAQSTDFFAVVNSDAGGQPILSVDRGAVVNVTGPTLATTGDLEVWSSGGFSTTVLAARNSVQVGTGAGDLEVQPAVSLFANLPTSDPGTPGHLYTSAGVLHVSL